MAARGGRLGEPSLPVFGNDGSRHQIVAVSLLAVNRTLSATAEAASRLAATTDMDTGETPALLTTLLPESAASR